MATTTDTAAPVVAHCGLVCSDCGMFRKGKCQGCHSARPMHRRCGVKACNLEHAYATCADCSAFVDLRQCRKLNNFISKVFGLIFRSDRIGSLERIRELGGVDTFVRQRGSSATTQRPTA